MKTSRKMPQRQASYLCRQRSDDAADHSVARTRSDHFQLTDNQLEVANSVFKRALSSQTSAVIGNAGTGKTTVLCEAVVPRLLAADQTVVMAAFTHRACAVLKQKLLLAGQGNVEVMTLARLLGFRETGTDSKGRPKFEKAADSKLDGVDVVIVDEASMVDRTYVDALFHECHEVAPRGLIFVGDDAQLAPVGHPDHLAAPAFALPEGAIFRLKQVHRNAGPILELANSIRVSAAGRLPLMETEHSDHGTVIAHDCESSFRAAITQAAESSAETKSVDGFRVLAFTNHAVREWNTYCRELVVGRDAPAFVQGEKLVSRNAIFDDADIYEWEAFPTNGASTELTILDEPTELGVDCSRASALETLFGTDCPVFWTFTARIDATGEVIWFNAIDPAENGEVEDAIRHCWSRARAAKESGGYVDGHGSKAWAFAARSVTKMLGHLVQPRYASTIHKSQGGEWPAVFVDLPTFDGIRERSPNQFRQLAYTGVTRAANALHLRVDR